MRNAIIASLIEVRLPGWHSRQPHDPAHDPAYDSAYSRAASWWIFSRSATNLPFLFHITPIRLRRALFFYTLAAAIVPLLCSSDPAPPGRTHILFLAFLLSPFSLSGPTTATGCGLNTKQSSDSHARICVWLFIRTWRLSASCCKGLGGPPPLRLF